MNNINYSFLGAGAKFYDLAGYRGIETPWWVTADIANITKPPGAGNYDVMPNNKCLVASGEQSFLYLANKGHLPPGKYHTVTPCFRNEAYDRYHSKQFMKLELIELIDSSKPSLIMTNFTARSTAVNKLAQLALTFFKSISPGSLHKKLHIITVDAVDALAITSQLDVVFQSPYGQIELGSYGMRQASFGAWIFGTGIAEPRFSKAIKEYC